MFFQFVFFPVRYVGLFEMLGVHAPQKGARHDAQAAAGGYLRSRNCGCWSCPRGSSRSSRTCCCCSGLPIAWKGALFPARAVCRPPVHTCLVATRACHLLPSLHDLFIVRSLPTACSSGGGHFMFTRLPAENTSKLYCFCCSLPTACSSAWSCSCWMSRTTSSGTPPRTRSTSTKVGQAAVGCEQECPDHVPNI